MGQTSGDRLSALPVWVNVAYDDERVRRFVEVDLGWQPVDPSTSRLVPPMVRIADPTTVRRHSDSPLPTVVLIPPQQPSDLASPSAVSPHPAQAEVVWPDQRHTLASVVDQLLQRVVPADARARIIRVGGTAGGVGTTTVALAMAGIAGWSGHRVLACVRGDVPVPGVIGIEGAAASAPELFARATPMPGVGRGRVVTIVDGARVAALSDPTVDMVVIDEGVDSQADVLVARPDRAGITQVAATPAASVVVAGRGPIGLQGFIAAMNPRRVIAVPWSPRVARAGCALRVPAGLPGSWLRLLAPLMSNSAVVHSPIDAAAVDGRLPT
ncbi:MAG: hypothetical protein WD152_05235 [Nitriliruptoraceae bacterium]